MLIVHLLGCRPTPIVPGPFHVAVLGDRTGEPDDLVWNDVIAQVRKLEPDLVFTVGDLADDAEDPAD